MRLANLRWAALLVFLLLGRAKAEPQWQAVRVDPERMLSAPDSLANSPTPFVIANQPPRQVDFVRMEGLPEKGRGTLWSSWGDGCVASNGRYYTSIGDHLGQDANSYLLEYDPQSRRLAQVVDIAESIGQRPGQYGHGKVHSGIHEAADGWLYFSTYWGKHREVEAAFGPDYQGSLLLRYRPATAQLENLGAIVPRQGLPTSHFDRRRNRLYFYAVYHNDLAVYDVAQGKLIYLGGREQIEGNRAFMHDDQGRLYMSGADGALCYFDPELNSIRPTKARLAELPSGEANNKGNTLRAAIPQPTPEGLLYAMTASGRLFAFDPARELVRDLGDNFHGGMYTAALVADPAGKSLFYAPGAHGSSARVGCPVVQYDIESGRRTVIAFLADPLRAQFGYQLGGCYNLQLDPAGQRLYLTFNGAPHQADARRTSTFGQPSVVVIQLR